MKKQNPRDLALSALNRLPGSPGLSGAALEDLPSSGEGLDPRDRAFLNHLVQGVSRWRLRLDWIIERSSHFPLKKIDPPVLNILRISLYQIYYMDRVPDSAAVNEAARQAKQAAGGRHVVSFVNGLLRNVCRKKGDIPMPDREKDPELFLSVFHSYPIWLVRMWVRDWGASFTEQLLAAGNRLPPLTLRSNALKIERPDLISRLREEGLNASPTRYSPDGISAEDLRGRVDRLRSFEEGLYQVQDEAAQVAAFLLDARPGERVLDACAGLGGKTTHLAERMGDRGRIVALDSSLRRLSTLEANAARLGIRNIDPVAGDASGMSALFRTEWDKIIVDAPCSGLGVISRHPDIKWNRKEEDLLRLADLQLSILREAAAGLPRGGRLLYMTCTLSKPENEGVVERLLNVDSKIRRLDLRKHSPEWCMELIDDKGFFRTFPHVHHMDGFFGAMFEKKT
jgi:16S rRNA (cytosine967-C5)-methyltransferase